jgi:hypothetical protein
MSDTRYVTDYPPLERHRQEAETAARARRRRLLIVVPVITVAAFAAASVSQPLAMLIAVIGVGVVFFLALPGGTSVPAGELAGVEGEVAVLKQLRDLPDEFVIFNRVRLPDASLPNGWRELDFVVAGPTGLWVIEVKNTPGLVYVQPEARHWPLARRAGCGSRPSWNAMDNPIGQVRAQVDALGRWLLQHAIVADPQPLICLSHSEVAVQNADASSIPVRLRAELGAAIRSAPNRRLPAALVDTLATLRPGGRTAANRAA